MVDKNCHNEQFVKLYVVTKTEKNCTVLVLRMTHGIWKETKQEPSTAGTGNMLGSCLVSFHFLVAILSTSTVFLNILPWTSTTERVI